MSHYVTNDGRRFQVTLFFKNGTRKSTYTDVAKDAHAVVEAAKRSGAYKRVIIRERVLDTQEGFL
jgi:hypothetical protein